MTCSCSSLTTGVISETRRAPEKRIFDNLAEAPCEGEKALERQLLTAKEDHEMVEPGTPDRGDCITIKIFREVDPGDFGAQSACHRADVERIARQ